MAKNLGVQSKQETVAPAQVRAVLRSRFGMAAFRDGQEEIIGKVLSGQNVLAIFPAGYGKSLLYQLPASLLPGMTLVFSPLVALMHDQELALSQRFGIPSVSLTYVLSSGGARQFWAAVRRVQQGRCKVVFIAPERLDDERVMKAIRSQAISLIVLDEAHCVSLWGHDFRPHYRRLLHFIAETQPATVLALTATAPPAVETDIRRQMPAPVEVFRVSPYRANLQLHAIGVLGQREKLTCLARIIPRLEGHGVIYCGTHEECENVADFLNTSGIDAAFYHAGLGAKRRSVERAFQKNRWKVVAATCALGMGIDKPDLRFVIHYRIPGSPELYYQEIGRAGRDGKPAKCILLFDPQDRDLQEFFLRQSHPQPPDYTVIHNCLDVGQPKTADVVTGATGLSRALVEVALANLLDADLAKRVKSDEGRSSEPAFCSVAGKRLPAAIRLFLAARESRVKALDAMAAYGETTSCLMQYLCRYLGSPEGKSCGQCTNCRSWSEKYDAYRKPVPGVDEFLASCYPRLKGCSQHDGGWALSFHRGTDVGDAVSRAKYGGAGVAPDWIVERAAECIGKKYQGSPDRTVQALTHIPPTADRPLVADLSRRLAKRLQLPCVDLLLRAKASALQKDMKTRGEKRRNIKGAFAVAQGAQLPWRSVLLIDDIYDSGWTFREAADVIRRAYPRCRVQVFALTRTHHCDDY